MENFISCLQARIVLGQQLTVLMLIFILAWLAYGLSHGYRYYLPYAWQYLRGKVSIELQTNKPLRIATLRTNSCNTSIQKKIFWGLSQQCKIFTCRMRIKKNKCSTWFLFCIYFSNIDAHEQVFKYCKYQYFSSPYMLLNDYKEERIRLLCFLYK